MPLFAWSRKRSANRPQTSSTRFRPRLEALERRDLLSFGTPIAYTVPQPVALATADVNGDARPDLLTLAGNGRYVSVQLGKNNGGFGAAQASYDYGGQTATAMAVGDTNGDGKLDIVLANRYSGGPFSEGSYVGTVTVLLGNGKGGFTYAATSTIFLGDPHINSVALADVYGDGEMDLVAASGYGGSVYVARPYHDNTFLRAQAYVVPAAAQTGGGSLQLAVADLTGDSKLDLAVAGCGSLTLFVNNGDGTFGAAQTFTDSAAPTSVAVGDVNGDGTLDLVTGNTNGSVSVLSGQGNGVFAPAQTYAVGGPANALALADFDGNGSLDVVTTGTETDVLLNNGNGTFGAFQHVGPAGSQVAAADVNGDGMPDLLQLDGSNTSVNVLLNTTNSTSLTVAGFPATTTAGVAHTVTVTALKPDGTVKTAYTGTIHFTSSDAQAGLPANYTFTAADRGVHIFTVTLKTAGTQSIVAATTNGSLIGGESGITVTPAAAAVLSLSNVPSRTGAGSAFLVMLTATDAFGNTATDYTGTVHFTSSDPQAVLPADYTFTAREAGRHVFYSAVTLETAGTQALTATDTAMPNLTAKASGIVVDAAAPATLVVSAPASVGSKAKFTVTVTILDSYGNVVPNWLISVQFTSSDSAATLPKNYMFTVADKGKHTFTNGFVLKTKGAQTITVTETANPALTATVSLAVI